MAGETSYFVKCLQLFEKIPSDFLVPSYTATSGLDGTITSLC